MKENEKGRILLYDTLKLLAILLVIIGHTTYINIKVKYGFGAYFEPEYYSDFYKMMLKIVQFIYQFHMPLFIFISGALFYKEINKENFSFENLLNKKIKSLLIPYLAYGILYTIMVKLIAGYYSFDNLPYVVIYEVLLGQNTTQHIWFLPTLFFITIMFYVVYITLKKDKKLLTIFFIIMSLFMLQINVTFPGVKYFTKLFLFFGLGCFFEDIRVKFEKFSYKREIVLFIICSALSLILYKILINIKSIFVKDIIDILFIIIAIFVCIIISIMITKIKRIRNCNLYKKILDYSFEIYVLGDPINYIILQLITIFNLGYLYQTNIGSFVIIAIRSIGVLIISILIAQVIRKLKKYEKFNKIVKIALFFIIVISIIIVICNSLLGIIPITYK